MKNILLKDIMTRNVITVKAEDHLRMVEEKFRLKKIRHIPVVDDHNQILGIITERDLLRCGLVRKTEEGFCFDGEQLDQLILQYVMTVAPVTLGPEDSIITAIDIMVREKFGCIPIVDLEKKIVGIVSQIDIMKWLSQWFSNPMNKCI